jgi:endonuclease YncB( thermonuclease family)
MKLLFAAIGLLVATAAQGNEAIPVTVLKVIDGDTLIIGEPCSRFDAKTLMRVRVFGIDTAESKAPPGKCQAEVDLGKKATEFARSLIKPGAEVGITYRAKDKWGCRIVASVTLPDGRDFAKVMIEAGHARPYGLDGSLTKTSWCSPP